MEVVVTDSTGSTRTLHRTVRTGGSFGSGSLRLHVGLGRAACVTELRVAWPDAARSRSTFANLAVDRAYRVVQGEPLVALERPPVPFRRPDAPAHAHAHGDARR